MKAASALDPPCADADPATRAPANTDGDALPDVREIFRCGSTGVLHCATNFTASGITADAATFPHRFSTKLFDPDTGLCYYGYRWYSPALGRWLSLDPIEEDGGANLYVFANNTALLHFDGLGAKCTPVSDPTPAPPYFWRVLKFEMDDKIKPSGGMYLLTGVHVVWGLKGRVVCCCGGQTVEKITMKTVERYIDLNQYLRAALKNAAPKSLDSGTWPNNPCQ